jgi:integrase
MALTDRQCRTVKPSESLQKLSDSGGLQFWVTPTGGRLWRYAYRFAGKQKLLALGTYPLLTLAKARCARDLAREQLLDGIDPSHARKLKKLGGPHLGNTFQDLGKEYLEKLRREGRAANTVAKVEWLLGFAYPVIGPLPLAKIQSVEVLSVLRTLEARGRRESARRLRSTIGAVFRYAIATARAQNDPTTALKGALTAPITKSYAAITEARKFGPLLRAIDGFDGQPTTRAALQLMALLFPRPGELRASEWSEFDLQSWIWTIPASRTKMRRPHRVPLSKQAVAILTDLNKIKAQGHLVFPSVRTWQRPLSENTLNAALRRLGYAHDEATAHGFRATASTLLNESGKWNADAIERQLAHVEGNNVRRAYARGEHWEERVRMMSWWANYLDELKGHNN